MPPQQLRDYQERGVRMIFDAWKSGARKVLATMPTGAGKTSAFSWIATQIIPKRTVVIVHRRELATQAANRFREFGVQIGYVMAGEQPTPYAHVQIASVQTLVRRKPPPADLVICDEAHLSTASTWQTVLAAYPNARVLGVTATPWRLSGKPLAGAYDAAVVIATPAELCTQGYLSPYVGFSYKTPDLSEVKTTGGDYNEKDSAKAMSAGVIVDSVVEEWIKHASSLSTVVFNVTVEHSRAVTERFKAAGVRAEHLDGTMGLDQRRAILDRVARGQTQVLCNVGIAVEGLDIPRLKCCVLNRPTKSLARAIQMMGRVRRPWEGVTARIHDHAFVIKQHGLPDDDRDYQLSGKAENPPSLSTCEECRAMYSGPSCPSCGHENERVEVTERVIQTVADAEQWEFSSGEQSAPVQRPPVEIRWDNIGRVVEGVFSHSWTDQTQYGPLKAYLIKGEKRDYQFHGTTRLNALMEKVQKEQKIRVTFTGETPAGGGRKRKEFKVEVDDKDHPHKAPSGTITVSEFARRRKCSEMNVRKAIQNGRLKESVTVLARGYALDPDVADREWEKLSDYLPTRGRQQKHDIHARAQWEGTQEGADQKTIRDIEEAWRAGRGLNDIAQSLGKGPDIVQRWIDVYGIAVRTGRPYFQTDPQI